MQRRKPARVLATMAVAAGVLASAASAGAVAPPGMTRVFSDPFANGASQHATAVEPDTFAAGSTIVMATQSGRYFDGGSSGIGFATSTNGGSTWSSGVLAGITPHVPGGGGTFDRVSDPSVAFDARHNVWMISSIPITSSVTVPKVIVSRSTDGGLHWGNPVTVANVASGQDFDKNWTACDNHPASPFYGRCYTTWDDSNNGDRLKVSTSTDGGLTWGPARNTANNGTGLGGQPVVQPNGTVIIPAADAFVANIIAFRSTDGGATWSSTRRVAQAVSHAEAGNLRSDALPSAEIDAAGKVYVVWQDCRFRTNCRGNDIVLSTSTDGLTWTAPARIPIGTTGDGHDNFIPGIGVDDTTSGATARLGLTYYFYATSACGNSCALQVGYIQSNSGGSTWSASRTLVGPFGLNLIANTSQGLMVGDYISTSWVTTPTNGRRAFGAVSVGQAPTNGKAFDEATFVPSGGLNSTGAFTASGAADRARPENESLLHANHHSTVFRRR